MDPCKLREPNVIDNALLERCVREQGPRGEAGRLARLEGIPLDEVKQLRLEFLNILRIDHLWVLKSITRLSLNNNLIEKIENMESLVLLTELDLSFNKIQVIENLDCLVNLEKLSLFDNLIETIENMDTLEKLTIFSIGRNRIDDLENIFYLRKFQALKSLNLAGNPIAENEDFCLQIAIFLPQIEYYEYRRILDLQRELGLELFGAQLRTIEIAEEEEKAIRDKERQEKADAELHSLSFVEYLNSDQLFKSLFKDDTEGNAFLDIDEIKEFYDEYEEQFNNCTHQIFEIGQKQYVIRQEELTQFMDCVEEAQRLSQEASITKMEHFLGDKAHVFYAIKILQKHLRQDKIKYEDFAEKSEQHTITFADHIHQVWKDLMKLELEIHEQMEEINQNFEHSMTEMVNVFIEAAQGQFSQIRALEVNYMENVTDVSNRYLTNANLNPDFIVPENLQEYMVDKDVLQNALGTTHDLHMQLIDNREDTLVSRAKQWLYNLVNGLEKDEIKRNRDKVLEVNHFLDIQKEEFDELVGDLGVTDADNSSWTPTLDSKLE